MKRLLTFSLVLLGVLFLGGQANATVTYDMQSYLNVSFSSLWNDKSNDFDLSASNTGEAYADWDGFIAWDENENAKSASVFANAFGQAGDVFGTLNGTAQSSIKSVFNLYYDFGSSPTDLTVTYLDSDISTNRGIGFLTMEDVTWQVYINFLYEGTDYSGQLITDGFYVFENLEGKHTFTLVAFAEGSAWTSYPAPVPEPGTMLLLGSGLVGLIGYGRRRMKN